MLALSRGYRRWWRRSLPSLRRGGESESKMYMGMMVGLPSGAMFANSFLRNGNEIHCHRAMFAACWHDSMMDDSWRRIHDRVDQFDKVAMLLNRLDRTKRYCNMEEWFLMKRTDPDWNVWDELDQSRLVKWSTMTVGSHENLVSTRENKDKWFWKCNAMSEIM